MKQTRYSRFFAILKEVNANGHTITKEEAVSIFTDGRTESLSSLSDTELAQLIVNMGLLRHWKDKPAPNITDPVRDNMRKAIISQFKSIGRTAKAAIKWAEKYGVNGQKRKFNDYTEQELFILIKNAEKVKEDFTKAYNKR